MNCKCFQSIKVLESIRRVKFWESLQFHQFQFQKSKFCHRCKLERLASWLTITWHIHSLSKTYKSQLKRLPLFLSKEPLCKLDIKEEWISLLIISKVRKNSSFSSCFLLSESDLLIGFWRKSLVSLCLLSCWTKHKALRFWLWKLLDYCFKLSWFFLFLNRLILILDRFFCQLSFMKYPLKHTDCCSQILLQGLNILDRNSSLLTSFNIKIIKFWNQLLELRALNPVHINLNLFWMLKYMSNVSRNRLRVKWIGF